MKSIAEPPQSEEVCLDEFRAIDDVPLTLRVELDRKTIRFRDLLELAPGSVVVFPRPTGENVDLYAESILLGSGEILVIDTALAVRVADLSEKAALDSTPESGAAAEAAG